MSRYPAFNNTLHMFSATTWAPKTGSSVRSFLYSSRTINLLWLPTRLADTFVGVKVFVQLFLLTVQFANIVAGRCRRTGYTEMGDAASEAAVNVKPWMCLPVFHCFNATTEGILLDATPHHVCGRCQRQVFVSGSCVAVGRCVPQCVACTTVSECDASA